MNYVVGLTGGIGSGKTVASDHFATLGVPIIDTDVIARQIVEPGQAALNALVEAFGRQILTDDGQLDRDALRALAFSTADNKARLDAITHPAIRQQTISQIEAVTEAYCIVVIPLLTAESPFAQLLKRVLVVSADQETKIARVKKRSQLSRAEIKRIMATQLTDQQRLAFASDVIDNNGSIAAVLRQVEKLHAQYLILSKEK